MLPYENKLPLPMNVPSVRRPLNAKKSRIPTLKGKSRLTTVTESITESKTRTRPKKKSKSQVMKPRGPNISGDSKLAHDYALTLVAPELGPISTRPDSAPFRDTLLSPSFSIPLAAVQDSKGSSTYVAGVAVFPQLNDQYFKLTAYDSSTQGLTWSAGVDNPNYATILSQFPLIAPISLSTRFTQTDPLETVSGVHFLSQIASGPVTGAPGALPALLTDVTGSPYTKVVAGNQVAENGGVRQSWLPLNTTQSFYENLTSATTGSNGMLIHLWIGAANQAGAAAIAPNFELSIACNFEAQPDEAVAFMFPSTRSVGGSDSVLGGALRTALSWIDAIGDTVSEFDRFMAHLNFPAVRDRVMSRFGSGTQRRGYSDLQKRESASDLVNRKLLALLCSVDLELLSLVLTEHKDLSARSLAELKTQLETRPSEPPSDYKLFVLESDDGTASGRVGTSQYASRELSKPALIRQPKYTSSAYSSIG